MNTITEFLRTQLVKWVDGFKLKNPQAFAIVAGVLYVVWYVLDNYLGNGMLKDISFNLFGMEIYVLDAVKNTLVFIMASVGAHTPQNNLPESPAKQ